VAGCETGTGRLRETFCKNALVKTGIPGYDYCLNPYTGCAHGCRYCYAETISRFRCEATGWGEWVAAKVNFPEVLRRELTRRRRPPGRVLFGTVTDVYQPAEVKYGLTRACLQALAELRQEVEVTILTKSALVCRDMDVLKRLRNRSVGFTITLLDEQAAAVFEPGAPPPAARLQAARSLIGEGIAVWVFIAPLLPGVGDAPSALEGLLTAIKKAGVEEIHMDPLNPYPSAVEHLRALYRDYFPRAVQHLEDYLHHRHEYLSELGRWLQALADQFDYDLQASWSFIRYALRNSVAKKSPILVG